MKTDWKTGLSSALRTVEERLRAEHDRILPPRRASVVERIPFEPHATPQGSAWKAFVAGSADLFGVLGPVLVNYLSHVSTQHRYLYYDTLSSASVSVKMTLRRIEIGEPTLRLGRLDEVHDRTVSPLLSPVQIVSFERIWASEGFLKFAFVRNPFSRLLSVYLDQVQGRSAGDSPLLAAILLQLGRRRGAVRFDEFVDAVGAQPAGLMDPRWMPQRHLLLSGRLPFDVIGRFERFDEDFAAIGRRIVPSFDRFVFRDEHPDPASGVPLGDHYDARLVETVRRVYAGDFDAYGYSRDLPGLAATEDVMATFSFAFPPPHHMPQRLRYRDAPRGRDESKILLVNRPLGPDMDPKLNALFDDGGYLVGISAFETWPARLHNPCDSADSRSFDIFEQPYFRRFIGFMHHLREPRDVFPPGLPLLRMDFSDFIQVRKRGREKIYDVLCYAGHRPKDGNEQGIKWGRSVKDHDLAVEVLRGLLDRHPDIRIAMVNDDTEVKDPRVTHFPPLRYRDFLDKIEASRIMLVASVLDASPRVIPEALCLDTYVMVNARISGGWKYVNPSTGAFFDRTNHAEVYERLRARGPAATRAWFMRNYQNHVLEARFDAWLNAAILRHSAFNRLGGVYFLDRDESEAGRLAMRRELFRHMGIYGDVALRLPARETAGDPARRRALHHLDALRRARELGLPDVAIIEEDLQFVAPREVANTKITDFFTEFPEWDVLLLGHRGVRLHEPSHDDAVLRVLDTAIPSGYVVRARAFDALIAGLEQACERAEGSGDAAWAELGKRVNIHAFQTPLGW